MPTFQITQVNQATPLPHRKILRSWLLPISTKSTGLALALALMDFALFAICMAGAVLAGHPAAQAFMAMLAGFMIARLFILGHDACHQSFTPHRSLNRWLGRLLFLPSLTPYSLWDVGHNIVHHGYTNLSGFDFVWQPATREAYERMPAWRQWLERAYRSGWAPWLYYLVEIWWKRLYFPSKSVMPTRRGVFVADSLLVTAAAAAWVAGLVIAALATGQSVMWLLTVGFFLPLLVWNGLIGFVVYVHHTHTSIAWYDNKKNWSNTNPFVSTTVHLTFNSFFGAALHHIMEHTAHHVDMGVPLYRLKQAQAILEARLPGHIVVQPFSWYWYFDTAHRCKLYDFERRQWTDFSGNPTSEEMANIAPASQ
jgi:omega-6 fatty acid desaturase (delta-12 desaturase)